MVFAKAGNSKPKTPNYKSCDNFFYNEQDSDRLLDNYHKNYYNLFGNQTRQISLRQFIREGWSVIEPGKEFISNWSIDVIAEHLEAVSKGEITRLLINVPPRHMKSLLCSVFWPTWEWTFMPYTQWITVSYGLGLSTGFSLKSRYLIRSKWYQKHWGKVYQLTDDQDAKSRYINNLQGQRFATAMLASVIGENADRIVIDDPHSPQSIDSDKVREATIEAYKLAISTRLNNAKTGAIVQVAQRLKENDLSNHLLELGFEHLVLPSEYNPKLISTTKLAKERKIDPRKKEGELLWPSRFDASVLKSSKVSLGAYGYAAQHDQKPAPAGGALFKEKDLRFNPFLDPDKIKLVKFKRKHRHWDLAATVNATSDYTASVLIGLTYDNKFIILDVTREKLTPGEAEKVILNTAYADGYDCSITIEEEKGSSGKHTTDYYRRNILIGFDCRPQALWADKVTRARAFVGQVEAHNVYLVQAEWNQGYISELVSFPKSSHKDQVDATSGAFRELMQNNYDSNWNNLKQSSQKQDNKSSQYKPINI